MVMGDGAARLRDYPGETVTVVCVRCELAWQSAKAEVLVRFGQDAKGPAVLSVLTARCPYRKLHGTLTCAAVYAELGRAVALPPG